MGSGGPPYHITMERPWDDYELHQKPACAVPLASTRQHPENQKEKNQAGHSPERAVEGQGLGVW